jgi:hypothetical protein
VNPVLVERSRPNVVQRGNVCAERDRLRKEQSGPTKGKVLGGRRW